MFTLVTDRQLAHNIKTSKTSVSANHCLGGPHHPLFFPTRFPGFTRRRWLPFVETSEAMCCPPTGVLRNAQTYNQNDHNHNDHDCYSTEEDSNGDSNVHQWAMGWLMDVTGGSWRRRQTSGMQHNISGPCGRRTGGRSLLYQWSGWYICTRRITLWLNTGVFM